MRKMLFVGDSITEGWLGASYIRKLRKSLKSVQFINRGLGGDTLAGISHRTRVLLKRREPDILVIQAGTHDLLLPHLLQRGGTWKVLVDQFTARGSVYARDKSDFKTRYQNLLQEIYSPHLTIVLLTISCLGEDLTTPLNQQRMTYNQCIRELAATYGIHIADVGQSFTRYLSQYNTVSKYLIDIFLQSYIDRMVTLFDGFTDYVSRRRRLHLTIDGVHPNQVGASLYAETILCHFLDAACYDPTPGDMP